MNFPFNVFLNSASQSGLATQLKTNQDPKAGNYVMFDQHVTQNYTSLHSVFVGQWGIQYAITFVSTKMFRSGSG